MSLLPYRIDWWKLFSKGVLIFLQFIETITFLTLSIHEINVLKSHDFRVIMQLHESFDYILTKTFYILTSVQCTYLPILFQGSFNNYVDRTLPSFDPPPCVDSFYILSMDKNRHFCPLPRWEIFMEQELKFWLDLGRMANFPAYIASQSFDL